MFMAMKCQHRSVLLLLFCIVLSSSFIILKAKGISCTFTCDDEMILYADGVKIGENNVYYQTAIFTFPAATKVMSVSCLNYAGPAGIIGSCSNGVVTNAKWRCYNTLVPNWLATWFDAKSWPAAALTAPPYSLSGPKLAIEAKWIWTADYARNPKVYCRYEIPHCSNDTTGDTATQGKFHWLTIGQNMPRFVQCPYGSGIGLPLPKRLCICNDTACNWLPPENTETCKTLSGSTTQELSNLAQVIAKNSDLAVVVSDLLVNLTTNVTDFQKDDVDLTTLILEALVNSSKYLNESGPNIVKSVNNILNVNITVWAESQNVTRTSTRTLSLIGEYLENAPIVLEGNITQNEPNIALFSQTLNETQFNGVSAAYIKDLTNITLNNDFVVYYDNVTVEPQTSQISLTLPKLLFESLGKDESNGSMQRISFVIYRKTPLFQDVVTGKNTLTGIGGTVRKRNSYVISACVKGQSLKNLKEPIVSTYYPLENGVKESTACVFWDVKLNNGLGSWSDVGCSYQKNTGPLVTCHCNHLTNFAILMDVYIDDYNNEAHNKALSYISYIGCGISLLGLFLTIATILIFKDLRSNVPGQILLNFCIALSLTLVVFLAAAERSKTSSMVVCRVAAIALHYFVLASFMWMAAQGFNMYLAFVKVLPQHISKFILKCCILCWGFPAIVVIITAGVAFVDYGDDNFCRLKGFPFQLAFLAPVLLILATNAVVFVLILRSLLRSGRKITADRRPNAVTQARRGAAISVVLGLTWLFGILAVKDAKLVFQYLFCIFNSVQGLLVFVFYCLLSSETRKKYLTLFCGNKHETRSGLQSNVVVSTKLDSVSRKSSASSPQK